MKYKIIVNGDFIGVDIFTPEEVQLLNCDSEITLIPA